MAAVTVTVGGLGAPRAPVTFLTQVFGICKGSAAGRIRPDRKSPSSVSALGQSRAEHSAGSLARSHICTIDWAGDLNHVGVHWCNVFYDGLLAVLQIGK